MGERHLATQKHNIVCIWFPQLTISSASVYWQTHSAVITLAGNKPDLQGDCYQNSTVVELDSVAQQIKDVVPHTSSACIYGRRGESKESCSYTMKNGQTMESTPNHSCTGRNDTNDFFTSHPKSPVGEWSKSARSTSCLCTDHRQSPREARLLRFPSILLEPVWPSELRCSPPDSSSSSFPEWEPRCSLAALPTPEPVARASRSSFCRGRPTDHKTPCSFRSSLLGISGSSTISSHSSANQNLISRSLNSRDTRLERLNHLPTRRRAKSSAFTSDSKNTDDFSFPFKFLKFVLRLFCWVKGKN